MTVHDFTRNLIPSGDVITEPVGTANVLSRRRNIDVPRSDRADLPVCVFLRITSCTLSNVQVIVFWLRISSLRVGRHLLSSLSRFIQAVRKSHSDFVEPLDDTCLSPLAQRAMGGIADQITMCFWLFSLRARRNRSNTARRKC